MPISDRINQHVALSPIVMLASSQSSDDNNQV